MNIRYTLVAEYPRAKLFPNCAVAVDRDAVRLTITDHSENGAMFEIADMTYADLCIMRDVILEAITHIPDPPPPPCPCVSTRLVPGEWRSQAMI